MEHLLIWLIEAIVKALKKPDAAAKAEEARRRRVEEQQRLTAAATTGPAPLPGQVSAQSTIPLPAAPPLPAGGVGPGSALKQERRAMVASIATAAALSATGKAAALPGSASTIARW